MRYARFTHAVLILFVLFSVACARKESGGGPSFDWPQWRGPDGNGISRETDWDPAALAGGPRLLWRVDVGQGYSNIAIKDNRLYTEGYDSKGMQYLVWCLDAATGRVIWRQRTPVSRYIMPPQSTPAVDTESGKRLWLYPWGRLGWCGAPDPVVADGGRVLTFVFGEPQQEVVLFRAASEQSEVLWRTELGIYNLMSTPVIVGAMRYGADSGARMRCIDLANGRQVGKAEPADSGSSLCLTVTAGGGKLIVLSGSGTLYIGEATPEGFKEISRCAAGLRELPFQQSVSAGSGTAQA